MLVYIGYIALFLILYPFVKNGFEEIVYDIGIFLAQLAAKIIKSYIRIKRWITRQN